MYTYAVRMVILYIIKIMYIFNIALHLTQLPNDYNIVHVVYSRVLKVNVQWLTSSAGHSVQVGVEGQHEVTLHGAEYQAFWRCVQQQHSVT